MAVLMLITIVNQILGVVADRLGLAQDLTPELPDVWLWTRQYILEFLCTICSMRGVLSHFRNDIGVGVTGET